MKDLFIDTSFNCGKFKGGIATYINGLIQGISELSVELNWGWGPKCDTKITCYPYFYLTKYWLRSFPKDFKVVHASSFLFPKKNTNQMATIFIHDVLFLNYPQFYPVSGLKFHQKSLKKSLKHFDIFMVPSRQTKNDLCNLEIDPEDIIVIPEGVDHLKQPNIMAAKNLLEQHGINKKFAFTVSTIEPRKNLKAVVSAFENAKKKLKFDLNLIIVGPRGWKENEILGKSANFVGYVSPEVLSGLYKLAEFFIYCPFVEGFGLPALEALYFGNAVIASEIPSLEDAPYLKVDPTSVDSIEEAICKIVQDEILCSELQLKGAEFAKGFTWKNSALKHLNIWKELLG